MSRFTSVRRTLLSSTVVAALGIASLRIREPGLGAGQNSRSCLEHIRLALCRRRLARPAAGHARPDPARSRPSLSRQPRRPRPGDSAASATGRTRCSSPGPRADEGLERRGARAASAQCRSPRRRAAIRAAFPGNCSIRPSRSISSRRRRVVYMIWQRDHMVRRIYLTDKHSENVKPSWFGESIGRYENGDTLVVDTIGLQTKNSYIDNFRTPHTEKLHVAERFKLAADGSSARGVRDGRRPRHLQRAAHMIAALAQGPNPLLETVCAENNERSLQPGPVPDPAGRRSRISDPQQAPSLALSCPRSPAMESGREKREHQNHGRTGNRASRRRRRLQCGAAGRLARSARMAGADRSPRPAQAHRQAGRCRRGARRHRLSGHTARETRRRSCSRASRAIAPARTSLPICWARARSVMRSRSGSIPRCRLPE